MPRPAGQVPGSDGRLAIEGGAKTRARPMPGRRLFGAAELECVREVFRRAAERGVDFGYQGEFEKRYTDAFVRLQGGGFADGVSSGTGALYLIVQSLGLPPGSEVLVSPMTDPGSVSAVILAGHRVVLADSAPGSFNTSAAEVARALTPKTRAALLTHAGGHPLDLHAIGAVLAEREIALLEDASQAHGARRRERATGTFGLAAGFSTMFSKGHASGGSGGIVYTTDEDRHHALLALADRGKPLYSPDFQPKDPATFLGPALNWNLDELSAAIGESTLARLEATIDRRLEIAGEIDRRLLAESELVRPIEHAADARPSLFFHTLAVDVDRLRVPKRRFAEAIAAEGIAVNPDYRYLPADWPWLAPHLAAPPKAENARAFRDASFNLLFHEGYGEEEIDDIVRSILKVERAYARDGCHA